MGDADGERIGTVFTIVITRVQHNALLIQKLFRISLREEVLFIIMTLLRRRCRCGGIMFWRRWHLRESKT